MTDRRAVLTALCGIATAPVWRVATPQSQPTTETTAMTTPSPIVTGAHDFDFLVGAWRVHHRRLKERLVNSHDWVEFDGTSVSRPLMDGAALVDDNVLELPDGTYRAAGLRAFDAKSGLWSIWWLDGRSPLGPLEPPVRGRFHDGVGTFLADEIIGGRMVRVRFQWSRIAATSCRWEQAFSIDAGVTWETNWEMDFERMPAPDGNMR
jgi:hypothetical protein